jgi:hypothetical protein
MSIPLAYQLDMETNAPPQGSTTELAVAKSKVKSLQKQVHELKQVKSEIEGLKCEVENMKMGLQEMARHRALDEQRAAYRQGMLFNGIKRIAEDLQHLKLQSTQDMNGKNDSDAGAQTPGSAKKKPRAESSHVQSPASTKHIPGRASENRKNFERALEHHMQAMNKAGTLEELNNAGDLAVKYSEELLKNFL